MQLITVTRNGSTTLDILTPKKKELKRKIHVKYYGLAEELFFKNEWYSHQWQDPYIKSRILDLYKDPITIRRFKQYKESVGNLRTKYNERRLLKQQEPTYLISLCYNDYGKPVKNANERYTELDFEDLYQKCIQYKIADPRFVKHDTIEEIRARQNDNDAEWLKWSVPPEKWIREYTKALGKEPYKSMELS